MVLRKFPLLIALLILLASMRPSSVSAQDTIKKSNTPDAELTAHLTNIANAALNAELKVLTNSGDARYDDQALSVYYQTAIQQKVAEASAQHIALLADGIIYGQYKLQLTVTDGQVEGDSAVLHASEYTAIELDNAKTDPLAPQTTEYIDVHTFRFQQTNAVWYLIEDQVQMPLNAEFEPQLGPETGPSASDR